MLSNAPKTLLNEELTSSILERVTLLKDYEEAIALIESFCKRPSPFVLSFINAHAFNLCCIDSNFSKALFKSDVIFRDGIGMKMLYNAIGRDPGVNLNGTDLIPVLVDRFRGKKIALIGTEEQYLSKAVKKLTSEGHKIVLAETGFHSFQHYLSLVKDTNPEVIILGMGMPKQEKLSGLLSQVIKSSCVIINGGAIIDRWGNKIQRAPFWVRHMGMEWLFRLFQEPRKIFFRVGTGGYFFIRRIRDLKKNLATYESNVRENTIIINYASKEKAESV